MQVRWEIKPSFDGIFTQQQLYQNLLKIGQLLLKIGPIVVSILFASILFATV